MDGVGKTAAELRLQGQHEEEGKKETMLMQTAIRMAISLLLSCETLFFLIVYKCSGRFVTLNYYL